MPALCPNCQTALPAVGRPVCSCCGAEIPGAFDAVACCGSCRLRPPAFDRARAPWRYAGPMRVAIRRFKYHRRWRLGRWMADRMALVARQELPLSDIALVLPVPLHWLKRRMKGFDHADDLARTVAERLGKPYAPRALARTRWTSSQTRLAAAERLRNVRAAFRGHAPSVAGQDVLLIDDVLTSGATAGSCAEALKAAGARRVYVLTAARTPLAR